MLPLLFFLIQRRIQLEQPFRKFHLQALLLQRNLLNISGGKRNQIFLLALNHQQRRFSAAKLHVLNSPNLSTGISYGAANQIAYIKLVAAQGSPFAARNLDLASHQSFRIADGIHAGKLQDNHALVEPVFVQLELPPHRLSRAALLFAVAKRKKFFARFKQLREIGEQGCGNFAVASLRFGHPGNRDELSFLSHPRCRATIRAESYSAGPVSSSSSSSIISSM